MDKIKFIMSGLWFFLRPFVKILLSREGEILIEASTIAVQVVSERMKGTSGAKKRQAAFGFIAKTLADSGIKLSASIINLALEAAVVKLKSEQPRS